MKIHFTIVSYTFPPSKEIGGRRWAKFSHYIKCLGHEVTVVCTGNSENKEFYESEYPGIKFNLLPKNYPHWLTGQAKSLKEKCFYSLATRFLNPFLKINLFDMAFAWKNQLLNTLENIHNENKIDVLVVTGAPFSLLYYGAQFKIAHPEIQYVGDMRDPWTWGSYYGIPQMSKRKKKFQEFIEHEAMKTCDMMCFPTQSMVDHVEEKYPQFSSKLYLLPHAFEPEKFPASKEDEIQKGFIYGGSIYNGLEPFFLKLDKILKKHPDSGFHWDIYTNTDYPLLDSTFSGGLIKKHSFVPEEELFKRIKRSKAYMIFFPKSEIDLISTKFFEIIYSGTPILYVGEEGQVGRFIRENRLGVHILPENMEKELPSYLGGNIPFEKDFFRIEQYSFTNVTKKFMKEIECRLFNSVNDITNT